MHALRVFTLAAILTTAGPALAAEGHDHQGRHGGIVVESGHHHFEVVARDGELQVHVGGEHGTPEMVAGAKATAAVLTDGRKVDVVLAPAGDTVLKGAGDFKASNGTTIVLTVTMPEHEPEQVRVKLD